MDGADLTLEELKVLREVNRTLDDLLEESLKAREGLAETFKRIFPPTLHLIGARGIAVTTKNEELVEETFTHGDLGGVDPSRLTHETGFGVTRLENGDTLVSQSLDLVGHHVGSLSVVFAGDRTKDAPRLSRLVETIAEELDTVLASIHTAAEKHQLLVAINRSLSNRVFEIGMDGAVRAMCEQVKLPGFCLLYRDPLEPSALHYRIYTYGQLEYASNGRALEPLADAIRRFGPALVAPHDKHLKEVWGNRRAVETVLISGFSEASALGKILVWNTNGESFSAFTMELLHLVASTLSQRLIDYNRERIHLAQFFSTPAIDKLLRDPDYERRYLHPRAEDIGILFADINGFTRICEQVLERPERIGTFVDDWSEEAVRIVHRYGGVFDKMVGDCVIGLWGPPFFADSRAERAGAAVKAAIEIQRFTRETMSAHPEVSRLSELLKLPGLGVAIGVNLAHSFCGLFGPNRNYTAFSTGMNQTARLQALGGFRETLVMEAALEALKDLKDPQLDALRFGPIQETPVKNVAQPLRYAKLLD
jgi:class 3 adenylate cyclase